ncbi:hypothetical protein BAUCODRAFT_152628 [Baudoinia panamericana UAMH 10762]|uniref:Protein NO VEIN C-terminal domain-containing protein n=1 Tax=Baudoinia panamericana (strain UAMH 10762) TaxID=717646 RepID=M2MYI9_BAUPA|nr:uncharacterized protein BAUCODRAFT_152628 [Baudoinia panamericana UAMH 10762]EMC91365.1 hypothetical protein BAUCODRAFT_152628 [Baudoinia panamericana UAMH 10762]
MDDVVEARALINDIRRRKHVDDPGDVDDNAKDLTNALRILSEELYSKPTHFILELIQNADDNNYPEDVRPKLTLLYREDGYLWIGCNEIGFTAANVRALCGIGDSTKKVENSQKGYIGEKGIGFKSAFKVAAEIWVKSGAISFKFDKHKPLGMIAPMWTDFFENAHIKERTMFCFHILPEHQGTVQENLLELKPELLLFLRKLHVLQVKIQKTSADVKHSFSLSKVEGETAGIRSITLRHQMFRPRNQTYTEAFLVFDQMIENMPTEKKRPNVMKSQIVLAFPVNDQNQPAMRSRLTFNFLPVRSYGLPFVLQADFMLSASREEILLGNRWNAVLVAATIDVFVACVERFNSTNTLRYTWPRFTKPLGVPYGSIFNSYFKELWRRLMQEPVLEAQDGTFAKPALLQSVPLEFTDGGNPPSPLIYPDHGPVAYLSTAYDVSDLTELSVVQQTPDTFSKLITEYASTEPELFRAQPTPWHSRLADAILRSGTQRFRSVAIIPMRDGEWLSSKDEPFYFADFGRSVAVPKGINVPLIDEAAAEDEVRRQLFSSFGARMIGVAQIYELILRHHSDCNGYSTRWTAEEAVTHAKFLYSAPSKPRHSDLTMLRLAAQGTKQLRLASELYMDIPGSAFRIGELFGVRRNDVQLLHPAYFPEKAPQGWLRWLEHDLGVRTLPRATSSNTITTEFRWLVENKASATWLTLLRDYWDHYTHQLAFSASRTFFANTSVECKDGKRRPLKEVYLATTHVKSEPFAADVVPFLAVKDSDDPRWTKLSVLQLSTQPDLRLYLSTLVTLPKRKPDSFKVVDVKRLYTGIQRLLHHDRISVVEAFAKNELVYVETHPKKWLGLKQCRGRSLLGLPRLVALADHYRNLTGLFVETLGVKDADASDVVDELCSLSGDIKQAGAVKDLLRLLSSNFVRHDSFKADVLDRLKYSTVKVMPVVSAQQCVEMRSVNDTTWFIADRSQLRKVFSGSIALLDLDMSAVHTQEVLLKHLGVSNRYLGRLVTEKTEVCGEASYHPGLTQLLRAKACYIAPLAHQLRRDGAFRSLSTAEMRCAESLVLRRSININGKATYARDDEGHTVFRYEQDHLIIYISERLAASGVFTLCDKLVEEFEIPHKYTVLLSTILAMPNDAYLRDELEKEKLAVYEVAVSGADQAVGPDMTDYTEGFLPSQLTGFSEVVKRQAVEDGVEITDTALDGESDLPPVLTEQLGHSMLPESLNTLKTAKKTAKKTAPTPPIMPLKARSNGTSADRVALKIDSLVDVKKLKRAANTLNMHDVSVIGRLAKASNGMAAAPHKPFDIGSLRTTLDDDFGPTKHAATAGIVKKGARVLPIVSNAAATTEADEYQLAIGSAGELFVFNLLAEHFEVKIDSWTSDVRMQHGHPDFEDFEGFYSDFTITNGTTCDRIAYWLGETGCEAASQWMGKDVTFHIEVKATSGRREEPFLISPNQFNQARQWHESNADVYIILRVYDLQSSPQVCAYVDPYAMWQAKELLFTAQGGYYVRPA